MQRGGHAGDIYLQVTKKTPLQQAELFKIFNCNFTASRQLVPLLEFISLVGGKYNRKNNRRTKITPRIKTCLAHTHRKVNHIH